MRERLEGPGVDLPPDPWLLRHLGGHLGTAIASVTALERREQWQLDPVWSDPRKSTQLNQQLITSRLNWPCLQSAPERTRTRTQRHLGLTPCSISDRPIER